MRNSMSGFTLRDLEYVESLHGRLAPVFAKMDEEGARGDIPIVGTAVGRTLSVLVRAIRHLAASRAYLATHQPHPPEGRAPNNVLSR